ncbi:UNKNOWN [Stylonychia lemnae]|uniref:Uncharacterized protein n=1 Tax=Stylonychia lemnae TaxID=5949 RepID=A0A078ADQ5_STYLE|nr:UNKNOWN [Stylonychia lemnae]|eukprot:CDW79966.1 UNKNOWN [Stylonychia lemnae]
MVASNAQNKLFLGVHLFNVLIGAENIVLLVILSMDVKVVQEKISSQDGQMVLQQAQLLIKLSNNVKHFGQRKAQQASTTAGYINTILLQIVSIARITIISVKTVWYIVAQPIIPVIIIWDLDAQKQPGIFHAKFVNMDINQLLLEQIDLVIVNIVFLQLLKLECARVNPYYEEHVRCLQINNAGTVTQGQWTGCKDGYVDSTRKVCVSNCGIGQYGVVTFNQRALIETSKCQLCDPNCYECTQDSTSCISCYNGYYLLTSSSTTTTGICKLKSGSISDTIYVAPVTSLNAQASTLQTGAYNTPFNSIQDAFSKAYEIGAPYVSAEIQIILKTGDHAMVRYFPSDFYVPSAYDKHSQTTKITLKTESGALQKVLYKLRDSWNFKVGAGLTIQNVYFEAIDSSEICVIPFGPSFFKFDISPQTMLKNPPTLNITQLYPPGFDPFFGVCSNTPGSSTPCFDLQIDKSTFQNFGYLKSRTSGANYVDPSYKLQYYGSIVDLDNFLGHIKITGSYFYKNTLKLDTCDVAFDMDQNILPLSDPYPSFGSTKSALQIRSLISITNYDDYQLDIIGNDFQKNTGTKGIIYIDSLPITLQGRVLIASNTFTLNAGYIDNSVLYIRARGPFGGSVYDMIPSYGNLFCTGYQIERNTFSKNFGCSNSVGGVIKFECVNFAQGQNEANDRYLMTQLNQATTAVSYKNIDFTTYIDNTQSTTYNGINYLIDLNKNTFSQNKYTENYYSHSAGLINVIGSPRTHFEGENFMGNGEMAKEVTTLYGSGIISAGSQEKSYSNMIQDSSFDLALLSKSLINVERTAQVTVLDCTFDGNWQMEPIFSDSRAQIIHFSEFYGQFIFDKNIIRNQIGMNNAYLTTQWLISISTANSLQKQGSNLPLFRFQTTDTVIFKDFLSQGSNFQKIYYYEDQLNTDQVMFFKISSLGYNYDAQQLLINDLVMSNIQCLKCTRSPFYLRSKETTFTNLQMASINDLAYTLNSKSTTPFFSFLLRKPYTDFYSAVVTETLKFIGASINKVYSGVDGRFLNIDYEFISTEMAPTSDQVFFESSSFIDIKSDGNGGFAKVNLNLIRINILDSTFSTIYAGFYLSSPAFGGIFYAQSLGQITLNNVQATNIFCPQSTLTNGGGRFIYLQQSANFLAVIQSSTFKCSSSAYVSTTVQSLITSGTYNQGSCIDISTDTFELDVTVTNSFFQNCFTAYESSAIKLQTSSVIKTLTLNSNTFQENAAISGGSIKCELCTMILIKNNFIKNLAQNGADLFISSPVTSIIIDSHYHQGSKSFTSGGSIYYQELAAVSTTFTINKQTGVQSLFQTTTSTGTGGFITFEILDSLTIIIQDSVFIDNIASQSGGMMFIKDSMVGSLSIQFSNIQITGSYSTSGNGGNTFVPSTTASTSISIIQSTITNTIANFLGGFMYIESFTSIDIQIDGSNINQGKSGSDGGVFYAKSQTLILQLFNSAQIIGSKSQSNGGVLYFQGDTSNIKILDNSQIINSSASINGGVLYIQSSMQNAILIDDASIYNSTATIGMGGFAYVEGNANTIDILNNALIYQSKSQQDGGSFYLQQSTGTLVSNILNSIITFSQSFTGNGGFLYQSGGTTITTTIKNSLINNIYSGLSGGFIYSSSGGLQTLVTQDSNFQNLTADGTGGLAFLQGSDSIFNIQTGTIIEKSSSAGSGGVFATEIAANTKIILDNANIISSSSNSLGGVFSSTGGVLSQIEMISQSQIQTSYALNGGGAIYSDCITTQVKLTSIKLFNLKTGNTGGVLFLEGQTNEVTLDQISITGSESQQNGGGFYLRGTVNHNFKIINNCIFEDFHASINGGFLYFDGPITTLNIDKGQFNKISSSMNGGVIYISSASISQSITIANSDFDVFQSRILGSFIFIEGDSNPLINLDVSFSTFSCQSLSMWDNWAILYNQIIAKLDANLNTIGDQVSREGSILYIKDTGDVVFNQCAMAQGKSRMNGGAVQGVGSGTARAFFTNCKNQLQYFESKQNGGFIQIDNPQLNFSSSNCTWNHLYAGGVGGFANGAQITAMSVSDCVLINITSGAAGSFLASDTPGLTFNISNCLIQCSPLFDASKVKSNLETGTSNTGSLFSISNAALIISQSNTFQNCYTANGGAIFKLSQSTFLDINSTYSNNAALLGGAFILTDVDATFQKTKFINNQGQQGGTIYMQGLSKLTFQDVSLIGSTSYLEGGFLYVSDNTNAIQSTVLIEGTTTLRNLYSKGNGGGIYLNAASSIFTISSSTAILNSHSDLSGGFIYNQKSSIIDIKFASITEVTSKLSGSIIYSVYSTVIKLDSSQFQCQLFPYVTNEPKLSNQENTYGGAFYFKDSVSITTKTIKVLNCYIGGIGGVFYLENTQLSDSGLSIYKFNAAQKGGFLFAKNSIITLQNSAFDNHQAFDGGLIYLSEQFTLNLDGISVQYIYAANNGGLIYVTENSNPIVSAIKFSNMLVLKDISAKQNGGSYYFDHSLLKVEMNSNIQLQNSKANLGNGGVFYLKKLKELQMLSIATSSSYQQFSVDKESYGSFMYSVAVDVILKLNRVIFSCFLNSYDYVTNLQYYLNHPLPKYQAQNAFYLLDAIEIQSQDNSYQNCYNMNEGGVFFLKTSTNRVNLIKLIESGSIYQYNQANYGGVIYCQTCDLQISGNTIFQYNYAKEGGVFYIKDSSPTLVQNSKFLENIVVNKGGIATFFENAGSLLPKVIINFQDCEFIFQEARVNGQGGAFYISSPHISDFNIKVLVIEDSYSSAFGGIIYVDNLVGTLNIEDSTFSNFSTPSTGFGSMVYSEGKDILLNIKTSTFQCRPAPNNLIVAQALNSLTSSYAGAVYFKNSLLGIYSFKNTFKTCFDCFEGSAYFIQKSKLIEEESKFISNQALNGGAIKCVDSTISIYKSEMSHNQADSGGAFEFENACEVIIDNSQFEQNQATSQGGIMSITNSKSGTIPSTTILIKNCQKFDGAKAKLGGLLYVNHPAITIVIQNVKMTGQEATISGGIAYITRGKILNITNSEATNFKAPNSQFLFSSSPDMQINIINSQVTCNTFYDHQVAIDQLSVLNLTSVSQNTIYMTGTGKIYSQQNTYKSCGILEEGAVFRINGDIDFYDKQSEFYENSAIFGGVISCTGCNIQLMKTKMHNNLAYKAGAIKLDSQAYLNAQYTNFYQNRATTVGGVIVALTDAYFDVIACDFINNTANYSSAIDALGSSQINYLTIQFCVFQDNSAYQNTISLNTAKAIINMTQFTDNDAVDKSKNIFLGFAQVKVYQCTFKAPFYKNKYLRIDQDETLGSFFNIILDVELEIEKTVFINGISYQGGAIFISGFSSILIKQSQFLNNIAKISGGAIYANGFKSLIIEDGSRLLNNQALSYGDDFYLSNSEYTFIIRDTIIENPNATTSVYAMGIQLEVIGSEFKNIYINEQSEKGAAIQCLNCRRMLISSSKFSNLRSQIGGAIFIQDVQLNKRSSDGYDKYSIIKTKFNNLTAYAGGAIYLSFPQNVWIADSIFNNCRSLNATASKAGSNVGSAGAIFYECGAEDTNCNLNITGFTNFTQNFAQKKGGAIHWNYYEPLISKNVFFEKNIAGWYGDSISSYSQNLKIISAEEYELQLEKIKAGEISQRKLEAYSKTNNSIRPQESQYQVNSVRSGGNIPQVFLAHVDKYGQIVGDDFESKLRVIVDSNSFVKDKNTLTYTPVLEGSQSFTTYAGVSQIDDLMFTGAPGYSYRLSFTSSGIDESLPENKKFQTKYNMSSIEYDFYVNLRECIEGEYFTQVGKCIYCEANIGFSLIKMVSPGECSPCPIERAFCEGGANLGPRPGYWRRTNTSSNFIKCMNPPACLGWFPNYKDGIYEPLGQCAKGYRGILCTQCIDNYSSTGNFQCSKCPDMVSNVIIMIAIIFGVGFALVMMVRSTLAGALEKKNAVSIYMKILMNHFQLILLVSSFNFSWPEEVTSFFSSSSPVAESSSQIFSIDCFMTGQGSSDDQSNLFRTFFLKLLAFALLPILLACASYGFWFLNQKIKKTEFQRGKAISTLVITMFIIHPNIVQYMFDDFNCKNVDGEQRIYKDLQTMCWSPIHTFWSYFVAMPSIVVWGLGIPAFAFVLLTRDRQKLNTLEIREKLGFLYNGYKHDFYYWEIVIMYRKIILIFIAVFIQNYGVMTQALIVFLLLIICLILNIKTKPFFLVVLNDLETLSLITSILSVYCGIYFVSNIPQEFQEDIPQEVKAGISLGKSTSLFFFAVILISNLLFFLYWILKFLSEVKVMLIKKFQKIYLCLFLCFDQQQLDKEINQQKVDEEHQLLRDQYMKSINNLKKLYDKGNIVLTQHLLERCQAYLSEDVFLEHIGWQKNIKIDEKELQRQERNNYINKMKEVEIKMKDRLAIKKKQQEHNDERVQPSQLLVDETKQLEVDTEFFEAGIKEEDYINHQDKLQRVNRQNLLTQEGDAMFQTLTSSQLNTQNSLIDNSQKYNENDTTILDVSYLENMPLKINKQKNLSKTVRKPNQDINMQKYAEINASKKTMDHDSQDSDQDVWNNDNILKNNYFTGKRDNNKEINKHLREGNIERFRKRKNKEKFNKKMIDEDYIDKSKISRKQIKQAADSTVKILPQCDVQGKSTQSHKETVGYNKIDHQDSKQFNKLNDSNQIDEEKIERELIQEVDTSKNESSMNDFEIENQINQMNFEFQIQDDKNQDQDDIEVFSDDQNIRKQKSKKVFNKMMSQSHTVFK